MSVRTCATILRQVNPGGSIYVWSDMFDPNHNAQPNYYLVRGNLAGGTRGSARRSLFASKRERGRSHAGLCGFTNWPWLSAPLQGR